MANNNLHIETLLNIELTPYQRKHKSTVRWLINCTNNKSVMATGRTFLLAVCYIEEALKNCGSWIYYQDHYPSLHANDYLGKIIVILLHKNKDILKRAEFKDDCFRINKGAQ